MSLSRSDDFARQFDPFELVWLRRRKRGNLVGFLVCCTYSLFGLAMVSEFAAFGYFAAAFFGICAIRWWNMVQLPPEALLEMRSLDEVGRTRWPQATTSKPLGTAGAVSRCPGIHSAGGLWDREIDGDL
jgi:hypothetical protein